MSRITETFVLKKRRANIDYGFAEALTTYGLIGVKVWIYKGDVLSKKGPQEIAEEENQGKQQQPRPGAPTEVKKG